MPSYREGNGFPLFSGTHSVKKRKSLPLLKYPKTDEIKNNLQKQ
jgi:hypothetical protein